MRLAPIQNPEKIKKVGEIYEKVVDANKDYFDFWLNHTLFHWDFWISLALTILPWAVWLKVRKKGSADRSLFVIFFYRYRYVLVGLCRHLLRAMVLHGQSDSYDSRVCPMGFLRTSRFYRFADRIQAAFLSAGQSDDLRWRQRLYRGACLPLAGLLCHGKLEYPDFVPHLFSHLPGFLQDRHKKNALRRFKRKQLRFNRCLDRRRAQGRQARGLGVVYGSVTTNIAASHCIRQMS
ncbi:hypothetical protein OMP40_14865 [Cohnella rhizosphaerae]|uniref:Uncharacterized protein n=1 Tax=Cohnella rhizosphaerae TaxID=1457232 RepID=A0A9X4QUH6_9BACL|nr:hypothetical protein [Cohnella rhizosphaerae]MDG0810492.1 hypothetical protein [Cohnella rhizosphaerae]